jgi:hypothetical protein
VLTIAPAKEIKGKVAVPPSQDLFFLCLTMAAACGCRTRISPLVASPRAEAWIESFKNCASITSDGASWRIEPPLEPDLLLLRLAYEDIPYRDFTVFLLLGRFGSIAFNALPPRRFERWRSLAESTGCSLRREAASGGQRLFIDNSDKFHRMETIADADDLHVCLGLAMGLRKPMECIVDFPVATPLRHVLHCFGFEFLVQAPRRNKDEDPLERRMRFLKTGKKSEGPPQFTITVDFSKAPARETELILPGDAAYASLLFVAKCLVSRGSLVVENVNLETWDTQALQLLKSMGSSFGVQETHQSSFGSVGSVVVQKINPFGRKVDCRPFFQFASQLPAMVALAAFAQGQSIFRNLEDLRNDEPDGIERINSCIATLGARYGEMPDGIVIEGAKQFDGFDLKTPLPAPLAGAFAVAGLKCRGETTIADEELARQWPDFSTMLSSITEFKE